MSDLAELIAISRRIELKLDELTKKVDDRSSADELTIDRGILQVMASDDLLGAIREREKSIRKEGRRKRA